MPGFNRQVLFSVRYYITSIVLLETGENLVTILYAPIG